MLGGLGAFPGRRQGSRRGALPQLRGSRCGIGGGLHLEQGELARERAPVDMDFYATPPLWREKRPLSPRGLASLFLPLAFIFPPPIFLPPLPSCPRVGDHPWSGRPGGVGSGQPLPVLKSQPLSYQVLGLGWSGGGADCFRMPIRRSV